MSTQTESAILNVQINGEKAIMTFQELNRARQEQLRLVQSLNQNTPQYEEQNRRLQALNATHAAWRQNIYGVQEANKGMFSDWRKGFAELEELAAKVTVGTIVAMGVRGAIDFVKDMFNGAEQAYTEAQKTQTQLQQVVKSTGGIAGETKEQLEGYQKALMDQTGIDDDVIAKGEEMLLTFTNVRGKIYEQALPAIVDMTAALNGGAVSMEGIQKTAILVGKGLQDPINGATAWKKAGVALDDQQKEQIKTMVRSNDMMGAQAILLKELQKEFGGTAKAISDTDVGALQKFNTRIDNIKENIGGMIISIKGGMASAFEPFLSWMEKVTTTTMPEKLEQERIGLNALVGAIVSCNDNQQVRNQLIKELQEKYPDFIGNIEKERISNKMLTDQLVAVNEQYRVKIFIAANEDKLKTIQDKRNAAIRDEADARQRVADASGLSAVALAKLTDEQVRNLAVKQTAKNIADNHQGGTTVDGALTILGYQKDLDLILNGRDRIKASFKEEADLMSANAVYNEKLTKIELDNVDKQIAAIKKRMLTEKEADKANDHAELNRLEQKRKGILGIVDKPTSGPTKAEGDAAAKRAKELAAKLLKEDEDLQKKYDDLNTVELANTMAKFDKEIALSNKKYDDEIKLNEAYLKKKGLTEKEKGDAETRIADYTTGKTKAATDLKNRYETDLAERIKKINEGLTVILQSEYDKQKRLINDKYDAEVKAAGTNADAIKTIEANRIISLNQVDVNEKQTAEEEKSKIDAEYATLTVDKNADAIAAINKRYDQEIDALKQKHTKEFQETQQFQQMVDALNKNRDAAVAKKKEDDVKTLKEAAVHAAEEISNAVFTIGANNRAAELDAAVGKLEKQRNTELSNANLSQAQKAKINAKFDKEEAALKLKAWKADQKAKMTQAIINGALGVTLALATLPPPGSWIQAAAVGIATAAQVTVIAKEKPPQFSRGGIVPNGPSHSAGGMNITDPLGQVVANIEGGEPVISRNAYASNKTLVDALLGSGGHSIDYNRITSAVNGSGSRSGSGYAGTQSGAGGNGSPEVTSAHIAELKGMIAQLAGIVQVSDSKQIVLSNRVFTDHQNKNAQISDAVNG
ncbi:hypothetical protein [Mucilaginibacter sp.]|uniref:hypothetical protein n=1 Tax=Mucilaginibacter sp. TaxID=1882438 RepID=UPI0026180179|nr:hypothetical protein [Mucilaginibacter sp.]MDB4919856.1 phage tail tape measure protein family [Mucilaginibacter sp.]